MRASAPSVLPLLRRQYVVATSWLTQPIAVPRPVTAPRGKREVRLPRLLRTPPPGALYHRSERHGIAVTAIEACGMHTDDLAQVEGMLASPWSRRGCADDIHVVAGSPASGQVLCHTAMFPAPLEAASDLLGTADRPWLLVEQIFGSRLTSLLPSLPDLQVARVRELTALVSRPQASASRQHAARAMIELSAVVVRLIAGPLRSDVDVVVGAVAGRPFAKVTEDVVAGLPAIEAVEAALELDGKRAMMALLRLRQTGQDLFR